jgi:subtilase family serine protease
MPAQSGPVSGYVNLVDNALNATSPNYATQMITLRGAGILDSQTINFPNPGTRTYGVAPITLTATAASLLPVSYTVISGPATVSGSTLTITGPGSVTVQATQAGNTTYAPATPVSIVITVLTKGVDLIETIVLGPSSANSGSAIQVSDTIMNQGTGSAGASMTGFYISSDGKTKGAYLAYRYVSPLTAGGTSGPVTTTLTLNTNLNGNSDVIACADYANKVAEANETNSCTSLGPIAIGR